MVGGRSGSAKRAVVVLLWVVVIAAPLVACGIVGGQVPPDAVIPVHWDAHGGATLGLGSELRKNLWIAAGVISVCNLGLAGGCYLAAHADDLGIREYVMGRGGPRRAIAICGLLAVLCTVGTIVMMSVIVDGALSA